MRILERPSSVRVAFLRHQIDRLRNALVRRDARSTQTVESPQDVVMPARGERQLGPRRRLSGLAVRCDDLSGRSRSEQATLEEILLSAKAGGGDVRPRTLRGLVLQQSFEDADRRME